MDSGTLVVLVVAVALTLASQAAERDSDFTRFMRVTVVVITLYFLLNGVLELAAAAGGASTRSALGLSNTTTNLAAAGGLDTGFSLVTLALFAIGTDRIPGLRRLRPGRPISWLALTLFFHSLAANLAPSTATATVAATVSTPQTTADLIVGGLPFAIIGVSAVGPGVRRNLGGVLQRLGVLPLRPTGWLLGVAVGLLLVPLGDPIVTLLTTHLTPADCQVQQQQVAQSLQGVDRTALEQFGIALSAGISEELLFRGALQPRIGILLSSVLWATFHLQYTCHGLPSVSNLYILLLGLFFGSLRKWSGLLAAIAAHVGYDAAILLGASSGVIYRGATLAAELALLVLVAEYAAARLQAGDVPRGTFARRWLSSRRWV